MRTATRILLVCACLLFSSVAMRAQGTQVTPESLKTMLENLGYVTTSSTNSDGVVTYEIKLTPQDWSIVTDVNLSKDQSNIWMWAILTKIPDGQMFDPDTLLTMLKENDSMGPFFFSYTDASRRFFINLALANQNVTPAKLRSELDQLAGNVTRTQNLWDPTKWKNAPLSGTK
ncbi:MAG TPA: hypothetical protein VEH50_12320 [Methylomirabilota bacterium]|nr:hypothetical protein [Methylomirabilota bacterium]